MGFGVKLTIAILSLMAIAVIFCWAMVKIWELLWDESFKESKYESDESDDRY